MKKGKKWMALTGALAISVIALTGGSGAKAVQADASDEEVFEATQELRDELKEYAGIGKGIAYVDGKKVAEAELTFIIGR